MTLREILATVRASDRGNQRTLPEGVFVGHITRLHAQWQHERFPSIMQVTENIELSDEEPTTFENFRTTFGISQLVWLKTNRSGTLPRRETQYDQANRSGWTRVYGYRNSEAREFYIIDGLDLVVYASGEAQIRGQRALPAVTEAELDTHTNPLLEVHPNLYLSGVQYLESANTDASPARLASDLDMYQSALAGVQGSERSQRIRLP